MSPHPLKTFRRNHDPRLSQKALAHKLKVDRVTVARWETGAKIDQDLVPTVVRITGIPARVLRPDLAAMFSEAAE
jgi:DNA-binding transcriptional regulator YiaG